MKPELIEGGIFTDHRGVLSHVNDFDFKDVKRFYTIQHPDINVVRAWQGHQVERKWFYVVQGKFLVAWVKINDWQNPSPDLKAESLILTPVESRILCVPSGYANGIKALEENSKILIFSDMDVNQSVEEKIRYNPEQYDWFNWNIQ